MKSSRIPIEPLSEARWAKIDEAVFSALDAAGDQARRRSDDAGVRAPRRRFVAVVLVAAAAAALLFVAFRGVFVGRRDIALNPSHIETGSTPSRLAVGESSIEVGPSSAVVASGNDTNGVLVVVEKGRVDCEVTPRSGRPPFVVQAGNVRVRVVGTRFSVVRDANAVRVAVVHGAVEVSRGSEITMLHDGEAWPSEAPAPAPETVPVPVPETVPAPVPVLAAPRPSAFDPQKAYESAAKREVTDPEGAMAAYRRLAASSGAWGAPSLFAAGRLAADRGHRTEARALLEDYLARFPRGANAEDARRILARLR